MRFSLSFAAMSLGMVAATTPALAQAPAAPVAPAAAAAPALCHAGVTKAARKALVELQIAVNAKDAANIPAKVAAAQALATSADDKCFLAQMQVKAAIDRKDHKAVAAGLEAQVATGSVPRTTSAADFEALGRTQLEARAFADANASFERSLQLAPDRASALVMLGETRALEKRGGEAVPYFQKAIALEKAAGRKPEESWYKRTLGVAVEAESPLALGLARDWVTAYPTTRNWRDAIRLHGAITKLSDAALLDMSRLARLNKALVGEADYGRYAQAALTKGFPGEAKAVLDEGFAANAVDRNQPTLKAIHGLATKQAAGDRAALDSQAKAGGTAKSLMALAEAYYGYGDYAKAAELVRAAQGKAGVDAELANLRLGMALAASGDKAGAKAALDLVTGSRVEIARYWLTYLATRP